MPNVFASGKSSGAVSSSAGSGSMKMPSTSSDDVDQQQEQPRLARDELDPVGQLHRDLLDGDEPGQRAGRAEHQHHRRAGLERVDEQARQVAPA